MAVTSIASAAISPTPPATSVGDASVPVAATAPVVAVSPQPAAPSLRRSLSLTRVLLALGAAVVTAVVLFALVRLSGTSWAGVAAGLHRVSRNELGVLVLVWMAGLWSHSFVLTTALPGLSRRRALLLNVCGSAVSDLVPFGGAAGMGVNLAMVRSWNFSTARFAGFTMISNLWNTMAKLCLPAVVLVVALAGGTIGSQKLIATTELVLVCTALVLAVAVAAIADVRIARGLGRGLDRLLALLFRLVGSPRRTTLARSLPGIQRDTAGVIRRGWPQLTAGVFGYLVLQSLLWFLCLHAVGRIPSPAVVLTGFAVERVLTMVPFTPGGAGLAEAGSVALLISLGGDPAAMTAGVLLYRGFAFFLEIPVGGIGLLAWLWRQRRAARPVAAGLS